MDTVTSWEKLSLILSERSDFYTIVNLSIAIHARLTRLMLTSSVDEMLLLRYVNRFTLFRVKVSFFVVVLNANEQTEIDR